MNTRRRFILGLAIAVLTTSPCFAEQPVTIRVLTYNIRHGEGIDLQLDLKRIAAVIQRTKADLVALQEVDNGVRRSGSIDQPAELAKMTDMRAVFEKNIDFQDGQYGNAVLSRLPILRHENHHLPQTRPHEQRGALEVVLQVGQRQLTFFSTHFDHSPDDAQRIVAVETVGKLLKARPNTTTILAGDLNALPDTQVIQQMATFLTDAHATGTEPGFTFPADKPDIRIDYFFYGGEGLKCLSCEVVDEPLASDHRPLLAVFELQ